MITRLQGRKILENWESGLTNIQISDKMGIDIRTIQSMINRHGKKANRYIKLDISNIEQLIIGLYLGDGHISNELNGNRHSRLTIIHSIKQKDYFNWKVNKIRATGLHICVYEYDLKNKSGYISRLISGKTNTHPLFSKMRIELYEMSEGNVNIDFVKNIGKEGLSIWYLDDGSVTNDGFTINCSRFSFEEKSAIRDILYKNIGIVTNVTPSTLYIPKNHADNFVKIVSPFCIDSMKYKLIPYHQRRAQVKQGELLGTPEMDNQQPSLNSNVLEGSTTNSRVQTGNAEDSNADTSALPGINGKSFSIKLKEDYFR